MSKAKNFLMAIAAVLGMSGGMSANAKTGNNVPEVKKIVVPVSKKRDGRAAQYPTNVTQLLDMAKDALNKKQYKQCIDLSERILITGYKKQYAMARYLIGSAYMAQNNYDKAIENFELAARYYELYGISRPEKDINYQEMFNSAIDTAYQKSKECTMLRVAKNSGTRKLK